MKCLSSLFIVLVNAVFPFGADGQQKAIYPDSLKGVVIKIEPLSFLNNHLSGGIEVPIGRNFFDINVGASDLGIANYYDQTGGFLMKAGFKFPILMRSPFNILYLMPEIAASNYKKSYYDPHVGIVDKQKKIHAMAVLTSLGYRHVNPRTKFYYDGGIELGLGWVNHGAAGNNYNFQLTGREDSFRQSSAAVAVSCHFAVGLLLKKRSVNRSFGG